MKFRPGNGDLRKVFFSEEKKQKTFIYFSAASHWVAMACTWPRAPEVKVFWFFSSEKNILTS
jgi:hypothetical protein